MSDDKAMAQLGRRFLKARRKLLDRLEYERARLSGGEDLNDMEMAKQEIREMRYWLSFFPGPPKKPRAPKPKRKRASKGGGK